MVADLVRIGRAEWLIHDDARISEGNSHFIVHDAQTASAIRPS